MQLDTPMCKVFWLTPYKFTTEITAGYESQWDTKARVERSWIFAELLAYNSIAELMYPEHMHELLTKPVQATTRITSGYESQWGTKDICQRSVLLHIF